MSPVVHEGTVEIQKWDECARFVHRFEAAVRVPWKHAIIGESVNNCTPIRAANVQVISSGALVPGRKMMFNYQWAATRCCRSNL